MNILQQTPKESILFEDTKVLVALAFEPHTQGHSVVIWKEEKKDINKLSTEDYEYLMDVVNVTRDTLKKFYEVEKVYLMYFDEINWVHWHLVPRYEEKGVDVLIHKPIKIDNFNDTDTLTQIFSDLHQKMMIER